MRAPKQACPASHTMHGQTCITALTQAHGHALREVTLRKPYATAPISNVKKSKKKEWQQSGHAGSPTCHTQAQRHALSPCVKAWRGRKET